MLMQDVLDLIVMDAKAHGGISVYPAFVQANPEIDPRLICDAIREMDRSGMAMVRYADNEPLTVTVNNR